VTEEVSSLTDLPRNEDNPDGRLVHRLCLSCGNRPDTISCRQTKTESEPKAFTRGALIVGSGGPKTLGGDDCGGHRS